MIYRYLRFPVLLLALLAATAQAADIYRWTDAQGKVHYSDREPPSGAEKINEPPPPSALSPEEIDARLEAIRKQRRDALETRAQAKDEQARSKEERDRLAAQCAAARGQLQATRSAQRIRDADGHWYTGEERINKINELEATIREYCGSSKTQ